MSRLLRHRDELLNPTQWHFFRSAIPYVFLYPGWWALSTNLTRFLIPWNIALSKLHIQTGTCRLFPLTWTISGEKSYLSTKIACL